MKDSYVIQSNPIRENKSLASRFKTSQTQKHKRIQNGRRNYGSYSRFPC